ncbi:hypothetical protein [Actinoplanes sp. NPDC051851]|uniref:hypothetical protein n=1 Tax=Actinoplanes sp. NPDC051851 TaxID=3154753 RepID=UPI0034210871
MENITLVRAYNAALAGAMAAGGDPDVVQAAVDPYLTPGAVCRETPALPWGGTFTGGSRGIRDLCVAGTAALVAFAEAAGAPVTAAPDSYAADGDVVFRTTAMRFPATPAHEALDVPVIDRYVVADGRIDAIDVFFFDVPAMLDRLAPA